MKNSVPKGFKNTRKMGAVSGAPTECQRQLLCVWRRAASRRLGDFSSVATEHRSAAGLARKLQRGFTLIELMVVMAIISVLLAIAVPVYQKSIVRAKESVLRNNLFTIRNMIDEYTIDKQKAPDSLQDLVSEGYLRQVPQDPMTNSDQTWKTIMEETPVGGSAGTPGLYDVRSGSDKKALDGTNYSDW